MEQENLAIATNPFSSERHALSVLTGRSVSANCARSEALNRDNPAVLSVYAFMCMHSCVCMCCTAVSKCARRVT